jgi:hypothetical protein
MPEIDSAAVGQLDEVAPAPAEEAEPKQGAVELRLPQGGLHDRSLATEYGADAYRFAGARFFARRFHAEIIYEPGKCIPLRSLRQNAPAPVSTRTLHHGPGFDVAVAVPSAGRFRGLRAVARRCAGSVRPAPGLRTAPSCDLRCSWFEPGR